MGPQKTVGTTEISLIDCEENSSSDMPGTRLNSDQNIIVALHYKSIVNRNAQMEQRHTIEKIYSKELKRYWKDYMHLSDEYGSSCKEFVTLLKELQSMWNPHQRFITVAKHRINLTF